MPTADVLLSDLIQGVFDRLRPALQADGGDIELVALDEDVAYVRLAGACVGCPAAEMTLRLGVEHALQCIHPALRVEIVP